MGSGTDQDAQTGEPTAQGFDAFEEARRVTQLCNVCGYCSGLCEVFRAGPRRPRLADGDLEHLAHLCHNCRACWYACQYAPPHEFAINVPATYARVRAESYARHAWPRPLAALARRSATVTTAAALGFAVLLPLLVLLLVPPEQVFAAHRGPGAFYEVIPWSVMSSVAGASFGFALLALGIGAWRFRRAAGDPPPQPPRRSRLAWTEAVRDALTLRNLDGGGPGCHDTDERFGRTRRWAHHALFYGFLLCFAATVSASIHHHVLGVPAPYPLLSAPSLLGTTGGLGMVLGAGVLLGLQARRDPRPDAPETLPADQALLVLLLAVAGTGLVLQAFRETPGMGLLLAFHLGTVLALFLIAPYSKMAHGAYRLTALALAAADRRSAGRPSLKGPRWNRS